MNANDKAVKAKQDEIKDYKQKVVDAFNLGLVVYKNSILAGNGYVHASMLADDKVTEAVRELTNKLVEAKREFNSLYMLLVTGVGTGDAGVRLPSNDLLGCRESYTESMLNQQSYLGFLDIQISIAGALESDMFDFKKVFPDRVSSDGYIAVARDCFEKILVELLTSKNYVKIYDMFLLIASKAVSEHEFDKAPVLFYDRGNEAFVLPTESPCNLVLTKTRMETISAEELGFEAHRHFINYKEYLTKYVENLQPFKNN